jgi:hypothetical protein
MSQGLDSILALSALWLIGLGVNLRNAPDAQEGAVGSRQSSDQKVSQNP